MDRLTQMIVYASVVEHGSFTDAAEKLGIAKSTVSRHVASLEERLGARLLNRTTRSLSPTEIGDAYYQRCARIISDAEEADRAVFDERTSPKGTLRISAPRPFAARYLAPPAAAFLAAHPEVEVELALDDRLVDVISEGIDVAIRIAPATDSGLVSRRLGQSYRYLLASPAFLAEHGVPRTPAEVQALPNIVRLGANEPIRLRRGADEVTIAPNGRFRANDGEALLAAMLGGVGIGWGPDFMAREAVRRGELVRLLPEWEDEPRPVLALYAHRRLLSPKVRLFLDLLVERYASPAPWELAAP